jgi:methyl coenzyme M reductase subunit C-like uncharacterized protein (methanogenesis marker protein 7)
MRYFDKEGNFLARVVLDDCVGGIMANSYNLDELDYDEKTVDKMTVTEVVEKIKKEMSLTLVFFDSVIAVSKENNDEREVFDQLSGFEVTQHLSGILLKVYDEFPPHNS